MQIQHHTEQLIFFYIEHSENGFINEQGFNFSSNYCFHIDKESDLYTLTETKVSDIDKLPSDFFRPADNVTAIVGKNGVGKTTLPHELQYLVGYPKQNDIKPGYQEYEEMRYESGKRLAIIMVDGKLTCYHNFKHLRNETEVKEPF